MDFKTINTTFRIAIPRSNGYGFDHKTETIKIDCAFLGDRYIQRRIRDYIKNEMQIEDFVLLWYETPAR